MPRKKSTFQEFLEKSLIIHGNIYTYVESTFKGMNFKVEVVCKQHGSFLQTACFHTRGHGCPDCARNSKFSSTESFIEKSRLVHGGLYDYSLVQYISQRKKVIILCKKHGRFLQTPAAHLNGNHCKRCATSHGYTEVDFVMKAIERFGYLYGYREVKYLDAKTKVKIFCEKHGIFEVSPTNHVNGSGCIKCLSTSVNPNSPAKLYIMAIISKNILYGYKIGITSNIKRRLFQLNSQNSNLEFIIYKQYNFEYRSEAIQVEKELKQSYCKSPPDIDFKGKTEFFNTVNLSEVIESLDEKYRSRRQVIESFS